MMDERGQMISNPVPVTIGTVIIISILIANQMNMQMSVGLSDIGLEVMTAITILVIAIGYIVIRYVRGDLA